MRATPILAPFILCDDDAVITTSVADAATGVDAVTVIVAMLAQQPTHQVHKRLHLKTY